MNPKYQDLFSKYKSPLIFLAILLVIDILMVVLNVVDAAFLDPRVPIFSLDQDRNVAEYIQYSEEIFIGCVLALVAFRRREIGYLAWSALFLYLFIDDAFSIHELFGLQLTNQLDIPALSWIPQGIGEVLVSLMAAGCLFGAIGIRYLFKPSQPFKAATNDLIVLIGLVFFFGVVVDGIHVAFGNEWWSYFLLTIIEEFGELVVFSLITVYSYTLLVFSQKEGGFCFTNPTISFILSKCLRSR